MGKDKIMSYEEKSVGSTAFYQCEACPYMALAEDDIKFHLFTVHPELAKKNGLADNIQIPCPGCSSIFDTEETLRTHLRNHHKMGVKDIKKMVKSLIQIALKDAKLKKEDETEEQPPPPTISEEVADVIEIVPDTEKTENHLPRGVTFISIDELHKMRAPNLEVVDPKNIIEEACINIVYAKDINTQYINVSDSGTSPTYNLIQMQSVPPDLISSIQPQVLTALDPKEPSPPSNNMEQAAAIRCSPPHILNPEKLNQDTSNHIQNKKSLLKDKIPCFINNCQVNLKEEKNLLYHQRCHVNGKLVCPECSKICPSVETLHSHLWKIHAIDLELPTCEICGYKTYKKYRLVNIHMKCHGSGKAHHCAICSKAFKNISQLAKHKAQCHNKVQCSICQREFNSEQRLKLHIAAVHEKIKPFKCSECAYSASRKEHLTLHMRSHTGDKPYSCDHCEYRCADHNAMRRHKKSHTKESLYTCKYCPYSTIQSTVFAAHMLSTHPEITNEIHCCRFCPFKSVSKDKYALHLSSHTDKEEVMLMMNQNKTNKPSWTIPSETEKSSDNNVTQKDEENKKELSNTVNEGPIVVYDCDSLTESLPQNYTDSYCSTSTNNEPPTQYSDQVTDLSKDDNNCLINSTTEDNLLERHQFTQQLPLQIPYEENQPNLHEFLNTSVTMEQNLMQSSNVITLAPNPCAIASSINNNIMGNFPIRLPRLSLRNNIMLKPVDKISLPMSKLTGPIIKPTQILPVPSSSSSPVNICIEEGARRKKPKISVKSNLILKGPDQENMFHSQQKMAFRQLADNERFRLAGPVTFNNLITTQFMQLPPEPSLSESPNAIMEYPQETLLDSATTPVASEINDNAQIFSFNQQMNVDSMVMLPPQDKIQTNDPSYIKLEATIKQNTQSPSLERMCNADLLSTPSISREYKASPPLEDINKNMSEIKNEVKSDSYYNLALNNSASNPSMIDQLLIDNLLGEQYIGHMDLPAIVLQEITEEQNDVIEIDDNSDDNKIPPRYDINFPLESLYLMHNDFHYLENDLSSNNISNEGVNDNNRMVSEVPIVNQKDVVDTPVDNTTNDFQNFIQGKQDPMMNTSVRLTTNKINVKNIELMKN